MKGNSKGITPIIAIVLLMMITIALAGFTYIWLQSVSKTAANNTQNQLNQQQQTMMKQIRIDSAAAGNPGSLAIRNIGSLTIKSSEIAVFVKNAKVSCNPGDIAPGAVGTCDITCSSGDTVKVTAPGNSDETTCQ